MKEKKASHFSTAINNEVNRLWLRKQRMWLVPSRWWLSETSVASRTSIVWQSVFKSASSESHVPGHRLQVTGSAGHRRPLEPLIRALLMRKLHYPASLSLFASAGSVWPSCHHRLPRGHLIPATHQPPRTVTCWLLATCQDSVSGLHTHNC